VRNRSRKRDVKKKFEPEVFAEEVIRLIDEDLEDLEKAFANIQAGVNDSSSCIDFETYGDAFWEVFIAGGIVAPGGEVSREDDKFNVQCVLEIELDRVPELNKLANGVLQRHRFMRVILEDVLCKVCMFVNKYDEKVQLNFARFMANFIIEMQAEASFITKLQQEKSLVESGDALSFATIFFREFLAKSSAEKLGRALKAGKADRILTLLPSTKRTPTNMFKHFEEAGLPGYAKYLQSQTHDRRMEDMAEGVEELVNDLQDMMLTADAIKTLQKQQSLNDKDAITVIVHVLHEQADLSGKNRAKEYMKYIMQYADLLAKFTKGRTAEVQLMNVLLQYIMEDPDLEKGFMPTCQALYEHEASVLGEEAIAQWYESTTAKEDEDFAPYLERMEPFVQWLQDADEDEDED